MRTKTLMASCGIAAMLALGPIAAHADNFKSWDKDASGTISSDEYAAGADDMGLFDRADEDRDGIISRPEYGAVQYRTWDRDGDGFISKDEWAGRIGNQYTEDTEIGTFAYHDDNKDGVLDSNEFDPSGEEFSLFDDWDLSGDDGLDRDEYYQGSYAMADRNDSGELEEDEGWFGDWF